MSHRLNQPATYRRFLLLALCAIFAALGFRAASACEIKVRDSAFRALRDMHRLCVMGAADDAAAQAIHDELQAWLNEQHDALNLEVEFVDVDDPDINWAQYGVPSAPPVLPVVVLVGHNAGSGEHFIIDHWEPAPAAENLAVLANSPAREKLANDLGKHLAVMVYVPGLGPHGNNAREVVERSAAEWSSKSTLGVSLIEVDRTNPAERALLSFAGIPPNGDDWVGVLFGRGKLMSPPLVGKEITSENLDGLISQLDVECSCSKPLPSIGVDIPLAWHPSLDAGVVELADYTEDTDEEAAAEDTPGATAEDATPELETVATASLNELPMESTAAESSLIKTAVWTVSGLCLAVLAISIVVLRRH